MTVLGALAAEVVARATLRAVQATRGLTVMSGGGSLHIPCAADFAATARGRGA